ncbi:hypothetical protein ACIQ2D_00495 [Lysinibacillus sp. NPDC097287]|uniref:hypothetical protein n=1 Tax=Lysinibacillus sp. NPDC097287 TaxID=3364144 RepID=UPI0037FBABD4
MKKWFYLAGLSALLLVGCTNEEQGKEAVNETEKMEQEYQVEVVEEKQVVNAETLTLEQAMQIDENNFYNFKDSFSTTGPYYGDEYLEEDETRQDLLKRFHTFATDQFFTEEFLQEFKESCISCDRAYPFPQAISSTIDPTLTIDSNQQFTLTGQIPITIFTNEGILSKTFVLAGEQWKLNSTSFTVTRNAADFSSEDEKEYVEPERSNKALQFEESLNQLQETYNDIQSNHLKNSQGDQVNATNEVLLDIQDVIAEMEATIVPHDDYYQANKAVWDNDVQKAIANIEQETMGDSGQELAMKKVELEMQLYRAFNILWRYNEVL